jgi:hypothetical protein
MDEDSDGLAAGTPFRRRPPPPAFAPQCLLPRVVGGIQSLLVVRLTSVIRMGLPRHRPVGFLDVRIGRLPCHLYGTTILCAESTDQRHEGSLRAVGHRHHAHPKRKSIGKLWERPNVYQMVSVTEDRLKWLQHHRTPYTQYLSKQLPSSATHDFKATMHSRYCNAASHAMGVLRSVATAC